MNAKCYSCVYRGNVPGDAHSCCNHPEVGDPFIGFIEIARGSSGILSKLGIKINEHGFKKGWAMWPMNFDPIWIENCDGYEEQINGKI